MKSGKVTSLSFVFMLIISTVSIAFMIGSEVGVVSSALPEGITSDYIYDQNWGTNQNNQPRTLAYEHSRPFDSANSEELNSLRPGEGYVFENEYYVKDTNNLFQKISVQDWKDLYLGSTVVATGLGGNPTGTMIDSSTGKPVTTMPTPSVVLTTPEDVNVRVDAELNEFFGEVDNIQTGTGGVQSETKVKHLFGETGAMYGGAYLLQGLQWATIAVTAITMIGGIFAADNPEALKAIQGAAFVGIMAASGVRGLIADGGLLSQSDMMANSKTFQWVNENQGLISAGVGLGAAWLTYNAMWSKEDTKVETVNFQCLSWQAPHGGSSCELCNDGTLPCSEYRCKALGQSCSVINKGTTREMCVNTNLRDAAPPTIKPLKSALTEGFAYFDVKDMPPGAGFKIKSTTSSTGCIAPFTPIEFGIETNEPAQCKIDVKPEGNYSKMAAYFGGDNLYSYNHTEFLSLPSVDNIKNSSLNLQNGKELSFFIRCMDASGNANEADYELKICVDPSPDTTAPQIQGTSIQTGGCVASNTENATVDFYANEPSECKWNFVDASYDQMKYNMSCANSITQINALQVYTCSALFAGIAREGTNFFVRCKDQPNGVNESKRNSNTESYQYTLRGSNPLKLKNIKPNETIYGAIRPTPVELYAETMFGCDTNQALCYYSTTGADNSFVQFFDTNKADGIHTQRLDLYDGTHNYFIRCVDSGGNLAEGNTSFKLDIDPNAPIIARVFEKEEYLTVVTPRKSDCVFTNDNCDFLFDEGTVMPYANSETHVTPWFADKTYYIKCRDEFRSEPVDCSMVVRPTDNFLK